MGGAIVGGYSDADWLCDEVFNKYPEDAVGSAFALLGFQCNFVGDWAHVVASDVSLVYRRMCLRGHPSRGGSVRGYLRLQVSMELIRAFSGEGGSLIQDDVRAEQFVLDDVTLTRELQLTPAQAAEEAG